MIYLIHFERKLYHAQHYLGYTKDIGMRLEQHRKGNGSKLMRAVTLAHIPWVLARTWVGDGKMERRLHKLHNSKKLCPICNPNAMRREKEDDPFA